MGQERDGTNKLTLRSSHTSAITQVVFAALSNTLLITSECLRLGPLRAKVRQPLEEFPFSHASVALAWATSLR